MLNRTALIVRPRQPFVDWVRGVEDDDVVPDAEGEQTVYLVPEVDTETDLDSVLRAVYAEIFERELDGWYTDESLWPADRTLSMFKQWFQIEHHTIIEDLCAEPLVDDELFEHDDGA